MFITELGVVGGIEIGGESGSIIGSSPDIEEGECDVERPVSREV